MTDNTVFFTSSRSIEAVADKLAEICGVDRRTIRVGKLLDERWESFDDFGDVVFLDWHQFEDGDLTLAVEILFGAALLGGDRRDEETFRSLSSLMGSTVLFFDQDGNPLLTVRGGPTTRVAVELPPDYGEVGPVLLPTRA